MKTAEQQNNFSIHLYEFNDLNDFLHIQIKGTVHKNKNLCYSFNCDENWYIHVKSKLKWGNCQDFFSHFLHRKPVIQRKRKKGGFAVMNRTVERFILHS